MLTPEDKLAAVTLSYFDIHTTVKPLLEPNALKTEFRFLTDAANYQTKYLAGKSIHTNTLTLSPLSKWNFKLHNAALRSASKYSDPSLFARNLFWIRYKNIHSTAAGEPDHWKLQTPFACQPINAKIGLQLDGLTLKANFKPVIYLTPIGWSSTFQIVLPAGMELGRLIELINRFNSGEKLFLVNRKPSSLREIFATFSRNVSYELFEANFSPVDNVKTSRYGFVLLQDLPQHYLEMYHRERALLASILRGKNLSIGEWSQEVNASKFAVTEHREGKEGFALVDFERATLLALKAGANLNSLGCHYRNVQHCYMMFLLLSSFLEDSRDRKDANTLISSLHNDVQTTLNSLPTHYSHNQFCDLLYQNHDYYVSQDSGVG